MPLDKHHLRCHVTFFSTVFSLCHEASAGEASGKQLSYAQCLPSQPWRPVAPSQLLSSLSTLTTDTLEDLQSGHTQRLENVLMLYNVNAKYHIMFLYIYDAVFARKLSVCNVKTHFYYNQMITIQMQLVVNQLQQ